MKESKTNLEYLMRLCNVRGVEIAKFLHVDQSLVGKWKNGKRILTPDSGYIDQLAKLFVQKGQQKIENLFEYIYKEIYKKENLSELIKAFICSKDPAIMAKTATYKDLDADYSSVYYAYDGIKGRKKAMDYFLACAQNAGVAVTIYFHDSMCFDWLISDEEYFQSWGKRILNLLSEGSDVYLIIDACIRPEKEAMLLYKIYPLATNRHFNIYYINSTTCSTTYIIGGLAAVKGYNDEICEDFYTQIFTDHVAVRAHEIYMRNLLKMRKKDSVKRLSARACFENIKNLKVVSNDIYMFSATPTIFSLPPELLEKILEYNKELDEEIKDNLRKYNALAGKEFFCQKDAQIRCIFFLEHLKFLSEQEEIFYSDRLFGEKAIIRVRNEDFKAHLKFLAKKLSECERYNIGLIPSFGIIGAEISKLGYFACKRHCWTMISNDHSGAKALFFLNQELTELFFMAQECAWKDIPQAYTNKQNVKKIIEEIALEDK